VTSFENQGFFPIGARVKYSRVWLERSPRSSKTKVAVIEGYCRDEDCVRIRFEGSETPQSIHVSFIEPLVQEEAKE
jgi:hypothetical protein